MSRPDDKHSNDEAGAAVAERYRAGATPRADWFGCEEWEIPDARDCQ